MRRRSRRRPRRSEFTCLCNGQLLCTTHNRIIKNAERWKRRRRAGQPLPISYDQIPKWNIRRIDFTTLIAPTRPTHRQLTRGTCHVQ